MTESTTDRFIATFETEQGSLSYYSLEKLEQQSFPRLGRLPVSIRILAENVMRAVNGVEATIDHLVALSAYNPAEPGEIEIPFTPARVLLQDLTGVPCVVDLAAMRSAMARLGGEASRINPILPVDLVIDHSIQVDAFASPDALARNTDIEFKRNAERYKFLRWGQSAFENFSVVPPASGICHQVNLEYLGKVVQTRELGGRNVAFFDTLVGTDSHTPMINGLGIVGWGVGGIEAEAAMLGQPIYMLAPGVIGVRLVGELHPGVTATDLVLTVTETLRAKGVVGRFVEFFGDGLSRMSVPDRAIISNMAPEYGATVGYFPVDERTLEYLRATGRTEQLVDTVERYTKEQGVFRTSATPEPDFLDVVTIDLGSVVPSVAGPKRPQDRIPISELKSTWGQTLTAPLDKRGYALSPDQLGASGDVSRANGGADTITHGSVVLAAITSCTNTSNPSVLIGAALLARNAVAAGLTMPAWVKTSFAPGSVVVTEYLSRAGLLEPLERLGFHVVGYGCTTCIGNSGPLPQAVADAVESNDLVVAGVLSGNRNFEGRINPHTRANFLTSPALVVAYALAGTMNIDLSADPLGQGADGTPVYLADLWPEPTQLREYVARALDRETFLEAYADIETRNEQWNAVELAESVLYPWSDESTYIQEPPFFASMTLDVEPITPVRGARVLVVAGDSTTTDHISPAGAIDPASPAGEYLTAAGVTRSDFNSYGSRRGNDAVMTRGTFANIRFRNLLVPGSLGSRTRVFPSGEETDIYAASVAYREKGVPTIVIGGKDYGMGSSRDWAAKGVYLLGVRAVIAESFERIHRSNLVGMGVLPLEFADGQNPASIGIDGSESYEIAVDDTLKPRQQVTVRATREDGTTCEFRVLCRIDSPVEVDYYRNGGILQAVLRRFIAEST